ncbi:hypothetical protein EWM64_g9031 [Hericium alpestre]|uniref:Uncharacterized protein n=1 Tax=Hericium alpestre TaxID=135208 RepID=A0A4Y9ZJS6_9AGAM|nr:hypothetical protein EWM64_g9031 [Hericium alpestre]
MLPRNSQTTTKRKAPTMSQDPRKKTCTAGSTSSRQASIATEDEEDERHMCEGVDEVEELDSDGNTVRSYNVKECHLHRSGTASDKAQTSDNIIDDPEDDPEDDEAELKRMSQRWTSPVYAFFDPKPAIEYIDGRKCHSFKCSAKGCRQKIRHYLDTGDVQSTENMHKHIKKCWGEDIVHAVSQAADATVAREKVVKNYLKNGSITATFERKNKGQEYNGDLNFATDAWSSPNHHAFIALTVHLLLNGEPISILLDFVEVVESHSGINLAKVFAKILEDFGISEKILSVTCDNANANDTMIAELQKLLPDFPGENARTRCFTHIVNLIAKSLLRQFDAKESKRTEDSDIMPELEEIKDNIDEEEAETQREHAAVSEEDAVDADEGWVDEVAEMTASEQKELAKKVRPVRLVLSKLCKISFKILHSTTILLPAWKSMLSNLGMKERIMPQDVSTRWNSTYDMLEFALEYKCAVRAVVGNTRLSLDKYKLTAQEWSIAQQLQDLLHILKDATTFFSRGTPNLATVIPAMDHIDFWLTTDACDSKYHLAIWASLNVAKCTLNCYYTMTDLSEVYRIAMVLHPRHKLTYFKNAKWEQDWIDTAREVVQDEYDHSYALREVEGDDRDDQEVAQEATEVTSGNIFNNLPSLAAPAPNNDHSELDQYLSTDPEPINDPIACTNYMHAIVLGQLEPSGPDQDVLKMTSLSDVEDEEDPSEEYMMEEGWDNITL